MTAYRYILAFVTSAGVLAAPPVTTPHPKIQLVNGATIEFRSRHVPANLMGDAIAGGVVDEAGLMTPEQHSAVSSRRSGTLGPLHFIGNPGVVAGPFRKLCSQGETALASGGDLARFYSLHRWTWKHRWLALGGDSTTAGRAYREFIDRERETLWDIEFRRLYEAEWTEDESAVFRDVEDLTDGEPLLAGAAGEEYAIGVDVGQQVDYLVACGIGKRSQRADFMMRFRGVPYPQAGDRLVELVKVFPGTLWIETNGPGIALYQDLKRRGGVKVEAFDTTTRSKEEAVQNAAGALNKLTRRLRLAKMEPLQYELKAFRYTKSVTGATTTYRYGAPAGEHDDCVMALVLAWHGANAVPKSGVYELMVQQMKAREEAKKKEAGA